MLLDNTLKIDIALNYSAEFYKIMWTKIMWCLSNFNTSYFTDVKPEKDVLLTLLSPIYYLWRELGDLLGVHHGTIKSLSLSSCSDLAKMSDVLQSWFDNEPTPVTWSKIINMIEGPLQNKTLANEIRQKIISSKYFCY